MAETERALINLGAAIGQLGGGCLIGRDVCVQYIDNIEWLRQRIARRKRIRRITILSGAGALVLMLILSRVF